MRVLSSPSTTVLAIWLCHLAARAGALENDFSSYPSGSQSCLSRAADSSKCSGSTGAELNSCLCTNKGNFVYNTASCVAKDSPADLDAVYSTLNANCAGTGVKLTVSRDAFMAKAKAATAVTTSATKTKGPTTTADEGSSTSTTATTTTTSDDKPTPSTTGSAIADKGTWSSTAKVGVGVGIGVGASALVLLGVMLCKRYRRGKRQQQGGVGGAIGGPGPAGGPMDGSGYHPPGGPHSPYMGSAYGGDGSTVAGAMSMQHTGGSSSNMTGSWNKSPVSPLATPGSTMGGYWVPSHDGSNRNSLMPPQQYAHAQQGQPLLAELGDHQTSSAPVELPAHDHQPQHYELPLTQPAASHPPPSAQAPYQQQQQQQQQTFSQPFPPHEYGRTQNY